MPEKEAPQSNITFTNIEITTLAPIQKNVTYNVEQLRQYCQCYNKCIIEREQNMTMLSNVTSLVNQTIKIN